jgi:hypothetical protein
MNMFNGNLCDSRFEPSGSATTELVNFLPCHMLALSRPSLINHSNMTLPLYVY